VADHSYLEIGTGDHAALINLVRGNYSFEDAALFLDAEATSSGTRFETNAGVLKRRLRLLGWDSVIGERVVAIEWPRRANVSDPASSTGPDQLIMDYLDEVRAPTVPPGHVPADRVMALIGQWGYIWGEERNQLGFLLDRLPDNFPVAFDMHEVVERGSLAPSTTYCQDARVGLERQARGAMPTVVITEGSTDKEILQFGIDYVRPEYTGFLTLLDYLMKPETNAGAVVTAVRAFAAAGVGNRVIGLVDNDTAGNNALKTAKRTPLPDRMQVVALPHLMIAATYPTIGQTGPSAEDVNSLAVSIEFFLPDDVLNPAGTWEPVEWSAGSSKAGARQGALKNKLAIQKRFRTKANHIRSGAPLVAADWERLGILLDFLVDV
jgi:hypothetical protein